MPMMPTSPITSAKRLHAFPKIWNANSDFPGAIRKSAVLRTTAKQVGERVPITTGVSPRLSGNGMSQRIRVNWRAWLGGVLLGTCAVGCKGLLGSQGPPSDPLFATHKPQESKAEQAAPVAIAFAEPQVPLDPAMALAKLGSPEADSPAADQSRGNVPGILTGRPTPQEKREPENADPR
jgi:hypothetical protein